MNERLRPESPEQSATKINEELSRAQEEVLGLMDQIHELETKAGEDNLPKEEFDSIVAERDKLNAQFEEKWEAVKQLGKQWREAEEENWKKLEEWKKSE